MDSIYWPAFMIVEKVVLHIFASFRHHSHSTNIHYWSELGTLGMLATSSEYWWVTTVYIQYHLFNYHKSRSVSGHPHIFTYIFYVIIVYIICYPGHPHMFTYVYIYTILSGHPRIHTYIYTLNPTTLPLSHRSSNSRLLLLLLLRAAATPLKRWRRYRPQQTFQFVIYIYIYIRFII